MGPRPALAVNFYSGEDLYGDCTSSNATKLPVAACAGYAVGIADALATGIAINGFKACPPASATRGQIIKAPPIFCAVIRKAGGSPPRVWWRTRSPSHFPVRSSARKTAFPQEMVRGKMRAG